MIIAMITNSMTRIIYGQVEMLDLICCHPRVDPNLLDRAGRAAKKFI